MSYSRKTAAEVEYERFFIPPSPTDPAVRLNKIKIPEFQRDYSWGNSQVSEFLSDVNSNERGYYIGNMIFISDGHTHTPTMQVVDGQQRLVTISLILACLHHLDISDTTKRRIKHLIFEEGHESAPRIEMGRENLHSVYSALLSNAPLPAVLDNTQKKMVRTIQFIKSKLLDNSINDDASVTAFLEKIIKLRIIQIICETEDDAHEVFDGLNSTSLPLVPVELLKNAIFRELKQRNVQGVARENCYGMWEQMVSSFEQQENASWLGKFIRHYWFSIGGYTTNKKLYREIRDSKLSSSVTDAQSIVDFVNELNSASKIYINLRNSSIDSADFPSTSSSQIRADLGFILDVFRHLNLDQVYAVLLAAFRSVHKEEYFRRSEYCLQHIRKLLNFSIAAKLSGISPSSYEKIFADMAFTLSGKSLSDSTNSVESIDFDEMKRILNSHFNKLFSIVENQQDAIARSFSMDLHGKEITKAILGSCYVDTRKSYSTLAQLTIEHIIPENDIALWPNLAGLSQDSIDKLKYSLGNLALLEAEKNTACGASFFTNKIAIYATSSYAENHEISNYSDDFARTPPNTNQRSLDLANVFINSIR